MSQFQKMTTETENYKIAKETFERIQDNFPALTMNWIFDSPNVQLSLEIPAQSGLDFELNLNLQDDSELHISTNVIWCKLFSNDMKGLSEYFYDCVEGIINGEFRVVQNYHGKKMYNSLLQRPTENGDWKTIYRHINKLKFPWTKTEKNIIQNGKNSTLLKI